MLQYQYVIASIITRTKPAYLWPPIGLKINITLVLEMMELQLQQTITGFPCPSSYTQEYSANLSTIIGCRLLHLHYCDRNALIFIISTLL